MHRLGVLALLLLSLPLMASTCEFRASSGDGHHCRELEGDHDCDGVGVIVDTRVDGEGAGSALSTSGASEAVAVIDEGEIAETVEQSLAASVVPLSDLAPTFDGPALDAAPDGGSAAGEAPAVDVPTRDGSDSGPDRLSRAADEPIGEDSQLDLEPEDLAGAAPVALERSGEPSWADPIDGAGNAAIPEPGAGALFAVGVTLFAWRLQRGSHGRSPTNRA